MPNPKNWRTHPSEQADVLRGILSEIGYAGAVLAYEAPSGLKLIDGHLRAEITPDQEIPVLVLDVNDKEADKLLAIYDPLSAQAETDPEKLKALLEEVEFESEQLNNTITKMLQEEGITPPDFQPVGIDEQGRLDEKKKVTCPNCGHEF